MTYYWVILNQIFLQKTIPFWAALIVLGGFLVSLSILGLVLVGIVIVSLYIATRKLKVTNIIRMFLLGIFLSVALFSLNVAAQNQLLSKFKSISLISFKGDYTGYDVNDLSALTISANAAVASRNFLNNPILGGGLGSHPLAYDLYAPSYVTKIPGFPRWNTEDAASLFLRLLSETG